MQNCCSVELSYSSLDLRVAKMFKYLTGEKLNNMQRTTQY